MKETRKIQINKQKRTGKKRGKDWRQAPVMRGKSSKMDFYLHHFPFFLDGTLLQTPDRPLSNKKQKCGTSFFLFFYLQPQVGLSLVFYFMYLFFFCLDLITRSIMYSRKTKFLSRSFILLLCVTSIQLMKTTTVLFVFLSFVLHPSFFI